MTSIKDPSKENSENGTCSQALFDEFQKGFKNPGWLNDFSKRSISNNDLVFLVQKIISQGSAPVTVLDFCRALERSGRGDCAFLFVKMLLQSYPDFLEARTYQTKLLADFDPQTARESCRNLLSNFPVLPTETESCEIAYTANRMIEMGLEEKKFYLDWFEQSLRQHRSADLLAQYALFLRELSRYDEAYAVSEEAIRISGDCCEAHIVSALAASSLGLYDKSFQLIWRAFELNPHATWWNMVVRFSAYFSGILDFGNDPRHLDSLVKLLDDKAKKYPDMVYLPHRFTPWHIEKLKEKRRERIAQELPSPIFVTQGKCGSISVGNIISGGFDLPCVTHSLINQRLIPSMLREYLRGGACYVNHLEPTDQNIAELRAAGVKKMIVHVRDPRQIILSIVYHNQKYQKHDCDLNQGHIFSHNSNLHQWIDEAIECYWTSILKFQQGWLNASHDINITFTTFEEFMMDRPSFLNRLLKAYGGDLKHFNAENASHERIGRDFHFRKGSLDEWREVFSAKQIDKLNQEMPPDIIDYFGWKL